MKKWFFSKNGEVLGPFAVDEANDYVLANSDSYAWHPSYSHWMPVTCINEFENSILAPKPPSIIPKELVDEFIGEERKLLSRLKELDKHLMKTDNSLLNLDNEIKAFQDITQNCTAEVRTTLQSIEQQFANLSKNLSHFKSATTKGKEELTDISDDFNTRLDKDNQSPVELPKKVQTVKMIHQALPQEFAEALVDKITKSDNLIPKNNIVNKVASNVITENEVIETASTIKKKKIINTSASTPVNQVSMLQTQIAESDVAIAEAASEDLESVEIVSYEKLSVAEKTKSTVKVKDNIDKKQIPEKAAQKVPTKTVKVEKIEFSSKPSKEDILLASQLEQIDKPITYDAPGTIKPDESIIGEFDHILYNSINTGEQVVDEDKGKKRLRRRRRR